MGISQRILHLFSRGKRPLLDNFVVFPIKKNFQAKNGRKMAYFSLDCRCTPELAAKSAPPGVGQNRGKTKFFAKNETHLKFLWAWPASLRNFNSIHALVWSERPTEICQNLRKFHPCDLRSKLILFELEMGISQRILRLFSRGKRPLLDNFVVFPIKKNFQAKNGICHRIPLALPASLRNFNSIHALVWSERPA